MKRLGQIPRHGTAVRIARHDVAHEFLPTLTICYPDLRQLTTDLRSTGTTNPNSGRSQGLTGRRSWARLEAAYGERRDANGALPVTLEMVFGTVWAKPAAGNGSQLRDAPSSRSI